MDGRAAGNPKAIEEMTEQLLTHGAIEVVDGRVIVLHDDLNSVPVPEKLSGTMLSLIDAMQPSHQLVTKV